MIAEVFPKAVEPWHYLDGPGAIGPAVHVRSRTRAPFSLRAALAKYGLTYPDMKRLPRFGDERGDRSELERVMLPPFALTLSQPTLITREFPVGDPWISMTINLRGELNGAVGAAGTVLADAPLPLWNLAFTTDLDADVVQPNVPARALYRYGQFMRGTAGDLTAPTIVASAVTSFNVAIELLFSDMRLLVPEDSILDTRRYNAVYLTIVTGALADIVSGAANLTLQNVFADIEILRVSPRVPFPLNIVKVINYYKRYAPIAPANGDTFVLLDRVPTLAMKRLLWFGTTSATAGVPFTGTGSDALIDTFRITSNRRDHFGSSVGGVSRRTIRNDNKTDYSIETWPAGWYVYDTVLDKSLLSALATGDLSTLETRLAFQSTPANSQVSVLQNGTQKLRGTRGR